MNLRWFVKFLLNNLFIIKISIKIASQRRLRWVKNWARENHNVDSMTDRYVTKAKANAIRNTCGCGVKRRIWIKKHFKRNNFCSFLSEFLPFKTTIAFDATYKYKHNEIFQNAPNTRICESSWNERSPWIYFK